MRIQTDSYSAVFNNDTKEFERNDLGACLVVEFQEDNEVGRFIVIDEHRDSLRNVFTISYLRQMKDARGVWQDVGIIKGVASSDTYVNSQTGKEVDREEAIEIVDDTSKEKMDRDGNSYDPIRYVSKSVVKEGYAVKSDYYISLFKASTHGLYRSSILAKFEITD